MAYTTVDNPELYFQTKLWTGNGSTGTGQTGVGFQPDWIWIKARAGTQGTQSNNLFDSVRGEGKYLFSDSNDAESTDTNRLTSFDSDGFTVGSNNAVNASSTTYVAWNWKAGGSASSNSNGSITSSVSASTDAGFSIVKYTGTGANATVGHGLGVAPKMVIIKRLENATHWLVGGGNIGWTKNLYLSLTSAEQTYNHFQDQSPSSSVVYMTNDGALNNSSEDYIMYCFAEKKGFSKFGSYTGNGQESGKGPFIYLGFKPAFFLLKESSNADNWIILDNKRQGYNGRNDMLFPNLNNAEYASDRIELVSNGVKIIDSDGSINTSGATYIYMAFAESPFVNSNGIPNNAR